MALAYFQSRSPAKIFFHQLKGKIRRWVKSRLLTTHHPKKISLRHGECNRCGACCKIIFKCPFYQEKEGLGICAIYGRHFVQCRLFPLESKDLIGLEEKCGYGFKPGV